MNAPVTRRALLGATAAVGVCALPAAVLPASITAALAAETALAFDPAAFIADLNAAGYEITVCRSVPRGGEQGWRPSYFITPPEGRGFGAAYTAAMAKWHDAIEATPDHVERMAEHVFGRLDWVST